jgi:hypothetical protein
MVLMLSALKPRSPKPYFPVKLTPIEMANVRKYGY